MSTGVGFFDHMLDLLARHGRMDLTVQARGDLETGAHHTVEDVGICIGQALDRALGDRAGITRYGQATVPMDESRAACAVDISGRGLLAFESPLAPGAIGNFDHELTEEFFRAVAGNARLTLHLTVEAGTNAHHVIEAIFKAFARALRMAVTLDPTESRRAEHQGHARMTGAPTIAVVDYGMGNRRSVQKALQHVGATASITRDRAELAAADALVVPGVGAFPQGMSNLIELGLDEPDPRAARRPAAGAGNLPRHAAAVRSLPGARPHRRPGADPRRGEPVADRRPADPAHRLERGRRSSGRRR